MTVRNIIFCLETEVFEMSAYVDMLENKLDQMTHELVEMRKNFTI